MPPNTLASSLAKVRPGYSTKRREATSSIQEIRVKLGIMKNEVNE